MNIVEVVARMAAAEQVVVEGAVEAALCWGELGCGVRVERDHATLRLIRATPDPDVPYGTIHEHRV